ncbi:hypothetical protein VF21_07129 [Pseudogymnoascus sp. 05NY08]|nr:hypothetical protein VF21_07129 [Pseudogymnoascus sp. 05NY08]
MSTKSEVKSEEKPEAPEPPRFGRHDFRKFKDDVPPRNDKALRTAQLDLLSEENKALKKTCDELKKGHDSFVSHYFTKRFNDAMGRIKKGIRDVLEDAHEYPEQDPRKLRKLRDFLEDELAVVDHIVTRKRKKMMDDEEK